MADQNASEIRLLLCGDVMLGRGVDQILPHPGDPRLYEDWRQVSTARHFVDLAEKVNGTIPDNRGFDFVWGEALAAFAELRPDLRLINLETAITARGQPWPNKRVHYRMNPRNAEVLARGGIDFCALANNHTLDWGYAGLADTVATLDQAGIGHAGAGRNREEAATPRLLEVPGKGRVVVVSLATTSSGVPWAWAAGRREPGLNAIDLTAPWFDYLRDRLSGIRRAGDIVLASIHWGDNFGYAVSQAERDFAHRLIDEAGVDLVHGHSSHHVKGIELHNGKPILYGCGDLITDYEGIPKRPQRRHFASELGLIYLARFAAESGRLIGLEMRPTRMVRMQLRRGSAEDSARLCAILNQQGAGFGTSVVQRESGLELQPSAV